jgi:membrane protein required for colicin V production
MLIDAAFVILLFFACFKGLRKGLIMALFSIIAFIIGLAAALKLSAAAAARLSGHVNPAFKWLPLLSFLIVFLVVALLVNLGGRLLQKTFETIMLGWVNRIGGLLLYVALYSFIFSIFLFYAVQLQIIRPAATASSYFYPYLQPLGPKVINSLGEIIPFFKDMFAQLQQFFGGLSNKMQH